MCAILSKQLLYVHGNKWNILCITTCSARSRLSAGLGLFTVGVHVCLIVLSGKEVNTGASLADSYGVWL